MIVQVFPRYSYIKMLCHYNMFVLYQLQLSMNCVVVSSIMHCIYSGKSCSIVKHLGIVESTLHWSLSLRSPCLSPTLMSPEPARGRGTSAPSLSRSLTTLYVALRGRQCWEGNRCSLSSYLWLQL